MKKSEQMGIRQVIDVETRVASRKPLHQLELDAVLKMEANLRFDYFIKRICLSQEIWSLWDEDGLQSFKIGDEWKTPFWTDEEVVKLSLTSNIEKKLRGIKIIPIPIDDWVDEILWDDLYQDDAKLLIQPVPGKDATVIDVTSFTNELQAEVQKYSSASLGLDPELVGKSFEEWWRNVQKETMNSSPKGHLP